MNEANEGGRHANLKPWWIAAAVAAAGLAAGLGPILLRGPAFVERITVVNRGPYDIHVEASGDRRTWTSVTTADRDSTSVGLEVIDQGAIWIFRFTAQGRDGGEVRTTRADLRRARWTIEIPEAVTDRLRDAGAPPTP